MATYNFYIREIPEPNDPISARKHWDNDLGVPPATFYNSYSYTVSREIFVLYPQFQRVSSPATVIDKTPSNTTTNLYEFRIDTSLTPSTTYPYRLGFGAISNTTGQLVIRVNYDYLVNLDNDTWTTNNWTIGTSATFLSEITNFLAVCCDNSRALTGNYIEPLSSYSDFNIQIYKNGLNYSGTDYTFVIFYPGNDPEADQTITVTT